MDAPDRNAERAALVPFGDWWPDGWHLSAIIRRSRVAEHPEQGTGLVRGVSKYGDWMFKDSKLARNYGHYVFGCASNLEYANETMDFQWYPPQPTVAPGAFVQRLVNEEWINEEHDWPPILSDLAIIQDTGSVRQTGFELDMRAVVDRGLWRDGVSVPCSKLVRTYVSYTSPTQDVVAVEVPMPTPIRGDYFGQPVRLSSCLHPRVELTSINSDQAVIYDCTPDRTPDRLGNLMVFGATNFQTWEAHVCANQVTRDNGLWRRLETTVYPPHMPAITYA